MKMYMSDSALDVTDLKKGKKMKEKKVLILLYFISAEQRTRYIHVPYVEWDICIFSVKKVI